MLEIKRDFRGTRTKAGECADKFLKNPKKNVDYATVVRRVYEGAVVADRIARYFSEFVEPKGKTGGLKHVIVGGCGGDDTEARFGIYVQDFLRTYNSATVKVDLATGEIKVNVSEMHEMFKYVTYTKEVDIKEIREHLINEKFNVVIGECDWYGKEKVIVLNTIRHLSFVGEYELQIIHPTLGYTNMKIHGGKLEQYGLMQFVDK